MKALIVLAIILATVNSQLPADLIAKLTEEIKEQLVQLRQSRSLLKPLIESHKTLESENKTLYTVTFIELTYDLAINLDVCLLTRSISNYNPTDTATLLFPLIKSYKNEQAKLKKPFEVFRENEKLFLTKIEKFLTEIEEIAELMFRDDFNSKFNEIHEKLESYWDIFEELKALETEKLELSGKIERLYLQSQEYFRKTKATYESFKELTFKIDTLLTEGKLKVLINPEFVISSIEIDDWLRRKNEGLKKIASTSKPVVEEGKKQLKEIHEEEKMIRSIISADTSLSEFEDFARNLYTIEKLRKSLVMSEEEKDRLLKGIGEKLIKLGVPVVSIRNADVIKKLENIENYSEQVLAANESKSLFLNFCKVVNIYKEENDITTKKKEVSIWVKVALFVGTIGVLAVLVSLYQRLKSKTVTKHTLH